MNTAASLFSTKDALIKPYAPKTPAWNAADYAANSTVQQSWARELISQLNLRGNEHILDVGCGDGKVTAELAHALPKGSATGIDTSPEMIRFASKTFPAKTFSNLKFQIADARKIQPSMFANCGGAFPPSRPQKEERARVRGRLVSSSAPLTPTLSPLGRGEGEDWQKFDLIFSNAALHWVDDHQAFLRGAASCLRSGGKLVVSCGGKGNAHDVFLALRPEMRRKRWRDFFRNLPKPYFFYAPEDYEKWLPKFGFKIQSIQLAPKDATYGAS